LPAKGIVGLQLLRPAPNYAGRTVETISGQPFTDAVKIQTLLIPANPWDIQLNSATVSAVTKGDVLAGEIWLKRPADGAPMAELIFEKASPPYTQSFARLLSPTGPQWTRFRFAFAAAESYATGAAQFDIRLGYGVQNVELGGLTLTNYGTSRPLTSFPNDITYPGREIDAPWRAAAQERIEQHRKADLSIQVRDQDGFPLRNITVEVRQQRHAFGFGSAIDASRLLATGSDSDRYRGIITNWFNKVVLENDLKWQPWESNPARAKSALAWFAQRGIPVRGHNLIWPGTNETFYLPADVVKLANSNDTNRLRTRIDAHFTNILTATRGQCVEWDVINEATHLLALRNVLGDAEMTHWFKLARSLEPDALLFFNEYENLETAPGNSLARDRLYNVAHYLQTNGAPIQGIGLQSHFGAYLTPPDVLYGYLEKYAELGLALEATEFDINTTDESVQADYLRDFLTVCFSHPLMNGVVMWGFWEKNHWLPNAALIRADWSLKPNGVAWTNLVFGDWWTSTNVITDNQGMAVLRGFKGDYVLSARYGTDVTTNHLTLAGDSSSTLGLLVPAPELEFKVNDRQVSLSWESVFVGYRLMKSDTLADPHWTVTSTPKEENGRWVVVETLDPSPQFYRLMRY
jgi:GH35 family endo-1,4-beta-xylanase